MVSQRDGVGHSKSDLLIKDALLELLHFMIRTGSSSLPHGLLLLPAPANLFIVAQSLYPAFLFATYFSIFFSTARAVIVSRPRVPKITTLLSCSLKFCGFTCPRGCR